MDEKAKERRKSLTKVMGKCKKIEEEQAKNLSRKAKHADYFIYA